MILGACKKCDLIVYEVVAAHQSGVKQGEPSRLGHMYDDGTQVEFMLSDGSECALTFCLPCADALTAEEYQTVWDRIVADSPDVPGGRSYLAARYPIAILRRRRSPALGLVEIDRR